MAITIENNFVRFLFSTPVLWMQWPNAKNYNHQLLDLILKQEASSESRQLSNEGGWQSDDSLFKVEDLCVSALKKWLEHCFYHMYEVHHDGGFSKALKNTGLRPDFKTNAWANINRPGNLNVIHNHPSCHWSGVYYVRAPKESGSIAMLDPRLAANMNNIGNELIDLFRDNIEYVDPEEGFAVIFPSWIQHFVTPNKSNDDRVSIAFNSRITMVKD